MWSWGDEMGRERGEDRPAPWGFDGQLFASQPPDLTATAAARGKCDHQDRTIPQKAPSRPPFCERRSVCQPPAHVAGACGSLGPGCDQKSLSRPAPETLLLKFVADHLWYQEKRTADPAHGMPADVEDNR